jgi:heme A synthase
MDSGGRGGSFERWSPVLLAVVGAVVIVGLGATGSVVAIILGVLVWAFASLAVGYLFVFRPRLRELRARRTAQGDTTGPV